MAQLVEGLHEQTARLAAEAGSLVEAGRYEDAISTYRAALQASRELGAGREIGTWLLVAIGDAAFKAGQFEPASDALYSALADPGAAADPFLRLRLGQCEFEKGRLAQAAEHLQHARASGGAAVFESEHPKYRAFLDGRIVPLTCFR